MGLFKFLKPPIHQQFRYKPRYWDPKKEEIELRNERLQVLQDGGIEAMKARISGGFKRGAGGAAAGTYRNQRVQRSNGTLFIVIIALMVISYFAIEVYFPDISHLMESDMTAEPVADPGLVPMEKAAEMEEL